MNDPLCQRLDDYLAHDLVGAERDAFVTHLDDCAECRAAVSTEERLADCLRVACEKIDVVPPDLALSITGRIEAMRWRRRALAAIALAASISFIAFWLSRGGPTPDTTLKAVSPPMASAAAPVRVSFPGHKTLAVPVESESPNVTVLLVYPNLRTEPLKNSERNEP